MENFDCEMEESQSELLPLPDGIWNAQEGPIEESNGIEIPPGNYREALEMLEQPICPACHKSCSSTANLIRHYEAVHVNGSLTCDICFKEFSRMAHLNRHKRTVHSSIKPFSCPECGKPFNRQDKLKVHMDRQHMMASRPSAFTESNVALL